MKNKLLISSMLGSVITLSACVTTEETSAVAPANTKSQQAAIPAKPKQQAQVKKAPVKSAVKLTEEGIASYYAKRLHGNATASGETFDNNAMTAAHKTLPFGTYVKVTNVKNNKSVIVKVNDRGPFAKQRIVDLSFGAAERIDMVAAGIVPVKLEVLDSPNVVAKPLLSQSSEQFYPESKPKQSELNEAALMQCDADTSFLTAGTYNVWGKVTSIKGYGIQLGSFNLLEGAMKQSIHAISLGLKETYIQVVEKKGKRVYRVIYNQYSTKGSAKKQVQQLRQKGFSGGFVKLHGAA